MSETKPEKKSTEVNTVVDVAPNAVPSDWAQLGVTSGYDPRSADILRLWVLGPSNEGKSTFLASIPNSLILDFEDGTRSVVGAKANRINVKSYEQYVAVKDKLIADAKKGQRRWNRVTIDTADEWVGLIINQLQREKNAEDITDFGQKGHGYNLVINRCWSDLSELEEAGYTWACAGHLKLKTETNPVTHKERTVPRAAIFPGLDGKLTNQSDFRLTIYCLSETVEKEEKKKLSSGQIIKVPMGTEVKHIYYVDSFTTPTQSGKSRGGPLMNRKIEIPLLGGWDKFKKIYTEALEEAKKKYS